VLIPRRVLDGIVRGEVTLAFRRWDRPRVRPGTRLRTAVGLVAVESVDEVDAARISDEDARRSGFAGRSDLMAFLDRPRGGAARPVYRVALRHAGEDPRVALRGADAPSPAEVEAVLGRLARLDRASRHGPWTAGVLRLIDERPAVRAGDLAEGLGRERLAFKADVRKLKELGLTESLEVGYRLSPRGRVILAALAAAAGHPPRTGA
jgi:hypothetical protein